MLVSSYVKTIVSILAATVAVLGAALTDGEISAIEWINIGIAFVTALGVYQFANEGEGFSRYKKGIVAFAGAALAALLTLAGSAEVFNFIDVTSADWITVALAGLGAIGVTTLPNKATPANTVTRAASDTAV